MKSTTTGPVAVPNRIDHVHVGVNGDVITPTDDITIEKTMMKAHMRGVITLFSSTSLKFHFSS